LFFPGNRAALAEVLQAQMGLDAWMVEGSDPQIGSPARSVVPRDWPLGVESLRKPSGEQLLTADFLENGAERMKSCAHRLERAAHTASGPIVGLEQSDPPMFASVRECLPLTMGIAAVGVSWVFGALNSAMKNCSEDSDLPVASSTYEKSITQYLVTNCSL
jgi:hypothetical protein